MASYDITLSAASRQNLLSLQDTAALASTNQNRLATGKKVNSALDNPVNFFTAAGLTNRATALTGLLDGISNGIQTIQAASKGVDSMTSVVKSMQSTIKQAQSDAATNRPKIAGNVAFGTTAEVNSLNKSAQDIAYSKLLVDNDANATNNAATAAVGATPAYSGNLGLTDQTAAAADAVDPTVDDPGTPGDETDAGSPATGGTTNTVQIKAGNTTYSFDFSATSTVRDLVDNINKSGIASASVGSDGKLTVTGTGSDALSFKVGKSVASTTTGEPPTFTEVTANTTALFGSVNAAPVKTSDVGSSGSSSARSNMVKQFNDLRTQLNTIAKDSGFNGINLLAGDKLSIAFNEKTGSNQSKLELQGNEISSTSLGLGELVDSSAASQNGDFSVQNDADLGKAADALTNALTSLASLSSTFGSQLSTVQTRQDFTKQISDVLTTGASNLTNADMNQEAANSQALSTRQSLSISALSLANQAQQGILQLLR